LVAASVLRGRSYTIAPEVLLEIERSLGSLASARSDKPSADTIATPLSLEEAATAMKTSARIAETYCIRS